MNTPMQSWSFVIFVLAAAGLYQLLSWVIEKRGWSRRLLSYFVLSLSLGYYLVVSLKALALPFVFLLFYLYGMYVFGVMIDTARSQRGRRAWTIVGVLIAVFVLFTFKTTSSLVLLTSRVFGFAAGGLVAAGFKWFGVPVGISYFSFRVIHYLVEVYRGKEARASMLEFFHYVTFFPTMVSGPIHRFYQAGKENAKDAFGLQMRAFGGAPKVTMDDITYGAWRIFQGIVKKFVLADFFFRLAGPMMKVGQSLGADTWQLWFATHCYFLYLYIEFSGYSDIAIGVSRLFGYRVMENFNWPILAPNMREFWRRWHISLTNWLMIYVYFPLGGGRKGNARTDINVMITIIGVALWHKVSMNMLIWGMLEGLALVIFRHWDKFKQRVWPDRKPSWWGTAIGIFIMWNVHGILWPLFLHPVRIAMAYYFKMLPIRQLLMGG
jgi:alginate O-acetyltransferase complex protein AlgI